MTDIVVSKILEDIKKLVSSFLYSKGGGQFECLVFLVQKIKSKLNIKEKRREENE